jgi:ornithine decarboxylase
MDMEEKLDTGVKIFYSVYILHMYIYVSGVLVFIINMPLSVTTDATYKSQALNNLKEKYPVFVIKQLVEKHGSPLAFLSLNTIENQYREFVKALPRVQHHYALKPLPYLDVIKRIRDIGGYFDLATSGEIDILNQVGDIDFSRCIHSHPYKKKSEVEYALKHGIETFVFDCKEELDKLIEFKEKMKLFMRIGFPNDEARLNLSSKFGVPKNESLGLLKYALENGFDVTGISFHVGSQMPSPAKHVEAIIFCHEIFDYAQTVFNHTIKTLDIGGGFPIDDNSKYMSIAEFCEPIKIVLDELFPFTRIVSEPGRSIAGPSITLVMSVMGQTMRENTPWYYMDDGIYGSYLGLWHDHGQYLMYSLKEFTGDLEKKKSVLAGPTCDCIDIINQNALMPDMNYGDIIICPNMGAYTVSTSTDFNLFPRAKIILIDEVLGNSVVQNQEHIIHKTWATLSQ